MVMILIDHDYEDDDDQPYSFMQMFKDDGSSADKIKNDGIYSRYFTRFLPGLRHTTIDSFIGRNIVMILNQT